MVMKNDRGETSGSGTGGAGGYLGKHKTKILFGVIAALIIGSIVWQVSQ